MGGGAWDSKLFDHARTTRAAAGIDDFDYSRRARAMGLGVHATLDPVAKKIRESRDSAGHPNSFPVAVFFDVTGSMGMIPRVFQTQLGNVLMTLLIEKYGIKDAQVLIGALGDGYADKLPIQVAEFESDNRIDDHLRNVNLEGGGGGGGRESYGFAHYAAARMIKHDHYEKRGGKGVLFTMGDEACWPTIPSDQAKRFLGIDIEEDLSVSDLIKEASAKWHIIHIVNADGSYQTQHADAWEKLLGTHGKVIILQDHQDVAAMVAAHAADAYGVETDTVLAGLRSAGVSASAISSVSRSLTTVSPGALARRGTVRGSLPATSGGGGATRI